MALNIKNERVHDLARHAAELTGRTKTGAIELALERLLDSYGVDPAAARAALKVDTVHALAREFSADPGRCAAEIAVVEDLFDNRTGLPR